MNVLVTRPAQQSEAFGSALRQAGFVPVFFPVIEIRPAADLSPLDRAIGNLQAYEWLIFTSVNAVEIVIEHVKTAGMNLVQAVSGVKIAAIGPKTAKSLQESGIQADFIPAEYVAEAILPGLGNLQGKKVLLPQAELARRTLSEAIQAAGGLPDEITVYHTLPVEPNPQGLAALQAGVDWLTFTSPSTVENFIRLVQKHDMDPFCLPGSPRVACIGPITSAAAQREGFIVSAMAEEYTSEGLIQALIGAASLIRT